jgi:hypothetical protein
MEQRLRCRRLSNGRGLISGLASRADRPDHLLVLRAARLVSGTAENPRLRRLRRRREAGGPPITRNGIARSIRRGHGRPLKGEQPKEPENYATHHTDFPMTSRLKIRDVATHKSGSIKNRSVLSTRRVKIA